MRGAAMAVITHGSLFPAINKAGRVWGDGTSPRVLEDVVRASEDVETQRACLPTDGEVDLAPMADPS